MQNLYNCTQSGKQILAQAESWCLPKGQREWGGGGGWRGVYYVETSNLRALADSGSQELPELFKKVCANGHVVQTSIFSSMQNLLSSHQERSGVCSHQTLHELTICVTSWQDDKKPR